mgnify:CR=1 FL=1
MLAIARTRVVLTLALRGHNLALRSSNSSPSLPSSGASPYAVFGPIAHFCQKCAHTFEHFKTLPVGACALCLKRQHAKFQKCQKCANTFENFKFLLVGACAWCLMHLHAKFQKCQNVRTLLKILKFCLLVLFSDL